MKIDKSIFENIPEVPSVDSLDGGDTFIYKGDLYMKVADSYYNDHQAINLANGELISIEDMPNETGITPVKINASIN